MEPGGSCGRFRRRAYVLAANVAAASSSPSLSPTTQTTRQICLICARDDASAYKARIIIWTTAMARRWHDDATATAARNGELFAVVRSHSRDSGGAGIERIGRKRYAGAKLQRALPSVGKCYCEMIGAELAGSNRIEQQQRNRRNTQKNTFAFLLLWV